MLFTEVNSPLKKLEFICMTQIIFFTFKHVKFSKKELPLERWSIQSDPEGSPGPSLMWRHTGRTAPMTRKSIKVTFPPGTFIKTWIRPGTFIKPAAWVEGEKGGFS